VNSTFAVLDYSYVDIATGCEGPKNNFYIIPYPPVEAPTAPNISLCLNEAGTIVANGSNTATSIRWYQSDATTVIETDAGNTGSLSVAASADAGTTTYYVSAISANDCESPKMRVDVIRGGGAPTGAPVAGNVAICEGERAVLTATGTVGGAMYWYSDAALTNLVFIGNPYETLPLTTNTSFWVAEGAGSCGASTATKVDVVVRPPANLPFATQDYSICVGQVIPSGEGLSATCSDAGVGGTATTMISGTASFPIAIGPDGGVGGVVNFNANSIPAGSTITSVVLNATLAHTWAEDVILDLTSPSGTTINIVDGNAGNDNYGTTGTTPLTYTFTDAASTFVLGTVGNNDIPSGSYLPNEPFSTFDGLNASGNWSLSVDDGFDDDGGSMTSATLTINYQLPADAGSLTWWDAPVGGAQVGAGSPFVPVDYDLLPIGSTTFWAQCDETSTCGNKRVAVKFNVLPAIAAPLVSGDDAVCVGNQANMSVSNPSSNVLWYGNEELTMLLGTGATFTSAPLTETTTFYVVNDNGLCTSVPTQYTVDVNPLPDFDLFANPGPSFFSGNIEICEGTVVNLEVVLEDPDNQIALLYTEEEPSNLLADWLIRSQDLMEINTWSDMIYYVRVFDVTTGCFSKPVPIYIDVFNRPTDIEVRGATVCVNEPATIHADVSTLFDNPQPNDQVVVIWATEDGSIIDVQDIPTGATAFNSELNVGSFSDPGTYNFIATTQNSIGCTGVPQIVTVVVNPLPNTPRVINDTVCAGETATLRAVSTEGVIHWYNSSVSQNVMQVGSVFVIPQANGSNVFWASVVNENGCESARVPVGVTVNATPDAPEVAQESFTICLGQTATYEIVDPNPDLIYVWSSDPLLVDVWGTGEVFETPALSQYTAFYVTAIDPVTGCRSEPTAAWVFVDNTLVISSATSEPVCEGEDVIIKVATWDVEGAVGLFDWNLNLIDIAFLPDGDPGTGNEEWIADFTIPDLEVGEYIFYVREIGNDIFPCGSIPISIPVVVNPLPNTPRVINDTVCAGETATLRAVSTEGVIHWYNSSVSQNVMQVGSVFVIPQANGSNVFWASVVNENGCESARVPVGVTVNATPDAPEVAQESFTICLGQTATYEIVDPNPDLIYVWSSDPLLVDVWGTGEVFETPALSQYTAFYVTAIDPVTGCRSEPTAAWVFVDNTLVISSATSEPVCEGEDALIQVATWDAVSSVGLFDWNLDLIDIAFLPDDDTLEDNSPWVADFLIPDLPAGEYIFYVKEIGEEIFPCGSIPISVLVKVLAGPEKPVATNDSPTCEGGNVIVSAMGGTGSVYSWSGPNGFTSNAQTFEIKNAKSKDAGDYIVTIYNQRGCSASDTTTVVVNPAPALGEGQNPDYVKPVCEHDTLKLSVGSVQGVTYSWTGPDGFTSSEQNPMIANVTEADNQGFYTVVLTDAVTGCASKPYALLVNIDKKPDNVIAVNDGPKCTGEDINLSTGFVFGATYTWSGPNEYSSNDRNAVIENINAQSAGVYTVVVQVGACTSEPATTEVVVYPNPIADAGQDDTTEHGMAIQLNGSGGITYQWSPNEYLTPSNNVPNPFVNPPVGSNVYTLKVWNEYGCSDEDDVTIVVVPTDKLIIPEVITPNGDGNNDTWVIGFLGDIAGGYELSIYSRDGARLYSTQDYKNDWNGTYDGEELPDGTYWYVIRTTDRTYKGAVTIRR
jgi:gliding motility-associated-like protein